MGSISTHRLEHWAGLRLHIIDFSSKSINIGGFRDFQADLTILSARRLHRFVALYCIQQRLLWQQTTNSSTFCEYCTQIVSHPHEAIGGDFWTHTHIYIHIIHTHTGISWYHYISYISIYPRCLIIGRLQPSWAGLRNPRMQRTLVPKCLQNPAVGDVQHVILQIRTQIQTISFGSDKIHKHL